MNNRCNQELKGSTGVMSSWYNMGRTTEPCKTPTVRSRSYDSLSLISIHWDRPEFSKCEIGKEWFIVSNAADKSSNNSNTFSPCPYQFWKKLKIGHRAEVSCSGPQMIPGPEMIPRLNRKRSSDGKWSPDWTANDPQSPHHKYRMEWTQIWTVDFNFTEFIFFYNTSRYI